MTRHPALSWRSLIALGVSLAAVALVSALGQLATTPNIEPWYQQLAKPDWNPPRWAFPVAWTLLYLAMAVAAWRVWLAGADRPEVRAALKAYGLQLVLNAGWSWAFFAARSPLAGLIVIAILWPAILWTILRFWPVSRFAGMLLLPYLAWVSYALALNLAIFLMNR